MSIDKPIVVPKCFIGNSVSELCLTHYDTCNHLWLLNNEQVHNLEKSQASIVEFISCFTTVKARIQ